MMMIMRRRILATPLLWAMLAAPLLAAGQPKLPADAPYCALPGARQVFLSPMGEPFRAAAGQPYPSATWLGAADTNRDGMVDRAEFVAEALRFFRTLDGDHDGRLTPEEVAAYENEVAPEIALYAARPDGTERRRGEQDGTRQRGDLGAAPSSRSGRSDYGGPMGAGRYAWLNVPEPVAAADADINRVVDADEFAAAAGRRFDALDGARRGGLRLADLPKTPAQAAIEGPCRPRPKPRRNQPYREGEAGAPR